MILAIPEEHRKDVYLRIAGGYRQASQMDYETEDELLTDLRSRNREVLGFDVPGEEAAKEAAWQEVLGAGGKLSTYLEEQFPDGVEDWEKVLISIAKGIESSGGKK